MYPSGIHGGLNWYMVSCKGQHASSDIARVSEHAQFMCYMGEFRKAWRMLRERLLESGGGLANAWEDFGEARGGLTLCEVFLWREGLSQTFFGNWALSTKASWSLSTVLV